MFSCCQSLSSTLLFLGQHQDILHKFLNLSLNQFVFYFSSKENIPMSSDYKIYFLLHCEILSAFEDYLIIQLSYNFIFIYFSCIAFFQVYFFLFFSFSAMRPGSFCLVSLPFFVSPSYISSVLKVVLHIISPHSFMSILLHLIHSLHPLGVFYGSSPVEVSLHLLQKRRKDMSKSHEINK